MNQLQFPISKTAVAFLAGIVLGFFCAIPLLFLVPASLLLCWFSVGKFRSTFDTGGTFRSLAVYLLALFCGAICTDLYNRNQVSNFQFNKPEHVLIKPFERLRNGSNNRRFYAQVYRTKEKTYLGKAVVYVSEADTAVAIGRIVQAYGRFSKLQPPRNPGAFDYKAYLNRKGISAQIYLNRCAYTTARSTDWSIRTVAESWRTVAEQNLARSQLSADVQAMLMALVLGQQQGMSETITEEYRVAGAVHILSVSGLHIGILVLCMYAFLNKLPNTPVWRFGKLLTLLLILWLFAFLAGFGPSVVRSVFMVSFALIGKFINRKTNSIHTLVASAVILLAIHPVYLFDVGFQLSYLSLLSILILQPRFSSLFASRFRIVNYFRDLMSVSLAAQLGTAPLTVLYFHQFSFLFLISNLILIPVLGIVMIAATVAVLISLFTVIPDFFANIVSFLIDSMNSCVAFLSDFRQLVFENVSFSGWQCLLTYFLLVVLILYISSRHYKYLYAIGVVLLCFQVGILTERIRLSDTHTLTVLYQRSEPILIEQKNDVATIFTAKRSSIESVLNDYVRQAKVRDWSFALSKHYFRVNGKQLVYVDTNFVDESLRNAHIFILNKAARINVQRLIEQYQPECVVACADVPLYLERMWKESCSANRIRFYSVREYGAITIK